MLDEESANISRDNLIQYMITIIWRDEGLSCLQNLDSEFFDRLVHWFKMIYRAHRRKKVGQQNKEFT